MSQKGEKNKKRKQKIEIAMVNNEHLSIVRDTTEARIFKEQG